MLTQAGSLLIFLPVLFADVPQVSADSGVSVGPSILGTIDIDSTETQTVELPDRPWCRSGPWIYSGWMWKRDSMRRRYLMHGFYTGGPIPVVEPVEPSIPNWLQAKQWEITGDALILSPADVSP